MFSRNLIRGTVAGAALALSVGACTSPGKRTAIGAGAGAGAGAAIGGASGGWKGAGIGAAAGAAVGAAVGNYLDKQYKELERVADTKRLKNGILVDLKNDLLFDVGEAELRPKAINQLHEVGRILAKYEQNRIRIGGHTDSTGSTALNEELSEKRAEVVKDVLRAQGVREEQMEVLAFGEESPIATNETARGRQLNRRVELLIDVPAEKAGAVAEEQRGR